jgi:hypothetical protein
MAQSKIGWRPYVNLSITASSLWNSIYSVYNADAIGSSSLNTSLVAAYNGESNTNDSKGTNNGTAVGGVTYPAGKIGTAFQFNGTNAYVSLPNTSGQFNFDGDFTISVWFRSSNLSASRYFMTNDQDNGTTWGYGWSFFWSGSLGFTFQLSNGSATNRANFLGGYGANTWYHVVAVRTMGQKHKIYVNGVDTPATQFGSVNTTAGYIANQKMELAGISRLNLFALCDLDGVNMWNKALTASEITELYNSGNGAQYIGDNFYKPTTNDALNTNNGTAQGGLTYGVGKVGTAFQFNGTNAYVNMGDVMDVGTSSWSYSFWFNANILTTGNYMSLFSKSIAASSVGRVWCVTYGNKLQFNFSPILGSVISIETNTTFSTSTWYNITLIFDRADKMKIYSNGNLLAVTSLEAVNNLTPYTSTNYNTNHPFRIGSYTSADNTTPSALFNGKIDAFNVWNRVLTTSEITELYNSGNGKQYVSSLDSDAQAFIASAAITVATQQTAINTLVTDLKAANIWTKMKAIYPFVGGTPAQHRFNLKSPGTTAADFYLDFIGGGVHSANGYQPNGTTAYADTKLIPSSALNLNSTHLSVYLTTAGGGGDYFDMGVEDNSYNNRLFTKVHGSGIQIMNNSYLIDYADATFTNSTIVGHYINNRTSSNVINAFKNNTKVLNDTAKISQGLSVRPLYIAAHNFAGSPSFLSPRRQAFASIGNGLTDAEALAFYTAVQKYQTTLGRQV